MELIIPTINFSAIYPEIIITVFSLIILMLQAFTPVRGKDYFAYVSLIGILIAAVVVTYCPSAFEVKLIENSFSGMWVVDNYSRFFKLIFLLGSGLTILISINYVAHEGIQHGEYFALILFATLGMMIMASGADLVVIFLGLELMSISLYVLAGCTRSRMISNESALKYFLLGSFATGFFLYGVALLYGATGTTAIKGLSEIITKTGSQGHIEIIGMALLIIGFGFKIASVPFHMWTPDVYQGAPSPITAFMSAGPKAAAFAAFARVFVLALPSLQGEWVALVWILAVLTMTVGNIIALVQDNIKRMLAYSSIAHTGYILVAFLSAGELGIAGILYYLLAYTFMNIGAFAIITVLSGKGEEKIHIQDYAGIGYKHPIAAIAMSLFLFSLAGIPPTAGFMGKFYIFSAAIKQGYLGLAIIGVINSVISVYYYLRVTVAMYMKEAEPVAPSETPAIVFSPALVVGVLISVYGVLRLGIFPTEYIALVKQSFLALQ
jgi:NADH-quinone oxidoreductase subunit N